ncbi:MAG: RNA polymerase sporulation sigma factor SigK [Clostridiales bacterium]|jgi:RNA polymerase sporulation-specific sigma factor|nr:RNA polymerase sporulation sigma factor SigK [Clostridiales bacterium]
MIFESFVTFLSKIFCFASYVNNKGSFPSPLSPDDERKYLELSKNGDLGAREMLIRHNLRLVAHIVKKYGNAGEADDLISVGSIGLIKGVETFKYGKGSQFATYAAKCIENEILMYIRSNKKHRFNVSLSESVGVDKEGNEITLMDIIPLKEDGVFTKVETAVLWENIIEIIDAVLTKRENKIIRLRYGIGLPKNRTQLEVSKMLNISRSYVSRIEKRAIGKISKAIRITDR